MENRTIIIIPTYNEHESIPHLVEQIFALYPRISVMVVDDNSPDGTAQIVLELSRTYPNLSLRHRLQDRGFGKSYIEGFKTVLASQRYDALVTMDADLSHDPRYIRDMMQNFHPRKVILGSRYAPGGGTVGWELWRRVLSRWANFYCRTITGMPIKDATSGFSMIPTALLSKLNLDTITMSGYAFLMELKHGLRNHGAEFKEIPIIFTNRVGGESKISNHIIKEGIWAPWRLRARNKKQSNNDYV